MTESPAHTPSSDDDLYATFQPRRGRAVTIVMAIVCVALFTLIALTATSPSGGAFSIPNKVATSMLGVLIAAFLLRYARIRAVPDKAGVSIRNLILSRRVEWSDVEAVRFHGGAPWPTLALRDGEEVSVMAVQKADGDRAGREATRLATLVEIGGGGRRAGESAPEIL